MPRKISRSENMSRIRGRDTGPELLLRKALWHAGYRYRLHSDLPGTPDLVFPGFRLAVFVDGCFWHGCPIHYSAPLSRRDFWAEKLRRNVEHDLDVDELLQSIGWRPFHIWQHELRNIRDVVGRFAEILNPPSKLEGRDYPNAGWTAEPDTPYDAPTAAPWYRCSCGSEMVRVLAVAAPGSLRPKAKERPDWVELICTRCRVVFDRAPSIPDD